MFFFAAGRFIQSCTISNMPPVLLKASLWNSSWTTPLPAVIHCTSPVAMVPPLPALPLHALYYKNRGFAPTVRSFIDWLTATVGQGGVRQFIYATSVQEYVNAGV